MKIERYNQVVIAVFGTGALIGGLCLAVALLWSAVNPGNKPGLTVAHTGAKPRTQNLAFCPPISGGSFQYIPVGVVDAENADRAPALSYAFSSGGSSDADSCQIYKYGGDSRVFNVVIRDVKNGDERLLLNAPGVISSLDVPDSKCAKDGASVPCGSILWKIRNMDSNHDGRIDRDDVLTAYVSDLSVHELRPLSPPDADCLSAQWESKSKKWLVHIRRDTNKDGRFTVEDGSELLEVANSAGSHAAPVVNGPLIEKLREAALAR